MGGELVIAFLLARIAIWVWRGRRGGPVGAGDPAGPGGGGGFRAPAPARPAPRRAPRRPLRVGRTHAPSRRAA
jgi:hypothetical protein